jgi:hypothetical protein
MFHKNAKLLIAPMKNGYAIYPFNNYKNAP